MAGVVGIICGFVRLFISYYLNGPDGACIVFLLCILYIVMKTLHFLTHKRL